MGYTTDFLGHIDIHPALNEAEIAYLQAFGHSRRFDRPGGPYEVPANPYAEQGRVSSVPVETYNRPAPGQPQLWCQWTPCWDGCCLAFDGTEKFYRPVQWLEYLIGHFLEPGAEASSSGIPAFDGFSFDHVLEGIVVGCRRDNKELFAIRVQENVVTTEILRAADPKFGGLPAAGLRARHRRRPRLVSEAQAIRPRGVPTSLMAASHRPKWCSNIST